MSILDCGCRSSCTLVAVIFSVIIGVVTALLCITAAITVTPAFLWVLFGIAIVYLLAVFVTLGVGDDISVRNCICRNLFAFVLGALGTIFTSIILLAITFAATSFIGAIIAGGLLFFFSLMVISIGCLVRCLSQCYNN